MKQIDKIVKGIVEPKDINVLWLDTNDPKSHILKAYDGEWKAISSGEGAISYNEQTLTEEQQMQARTNIGAGTYSKPSSNIPKSDLASAVQTSLGKADTAYQKPSGGIPASDLASGVIPTVPTDTVKYTSQSLTDAQKGQARTNIGALSSADVASLTSEEYVEVASLPTADATTLGKIYLVGPDGNGDYDRYITSYDGANYTWQQIGSTSIDMSDYATKEGVDQLDQKVDKLGKYGVDDDWVQIVTDSTNKILYGVKTDGKFYFGDGCPPQVVQYVTEKLAETEGDFTTLLNGKVDKIEGKSLIDSDFASSQETTESTEWLQVTTDSEYRIIEGTNTEGEKHIGKFDSETENMIKAFVGASDSASSVINIPLLDANFTSPVPVTITGTKGDGNAIYNFELPLSGDSFNIRFKVRITENLLNQEKNAIILQLGNVYADAVSVPLSQYSTAGTFDGSSVTMLWNDFRGGIKYNGRGGDTGTSPFALGNFAFYVQYVGSESTASVENDGTKFILKIGSTTTEFPYSTYETVSSLYEAIKAIPDVAVDYKELEGRMCEELAIFPECQIKTTCYTSTDRFHANLVEEYVDAYQFYIPYAVDDQWHQVEIVKLGNTVYCSLDGILRAFQYNGSSYDYTHLLLGDGNAMYFKDLSIDLASPGDAEYWENGGRLISSANPIIIITEGHGMYDSPVAESSSAPDNLATSTDRLYYVYGRMESMGYVPVSIQDIADYYAGNKELPKRCFTSVFDGERWGDWLETRSRKAFSELGVYPTIAAVTGGTNNVTYNVYGGTKTVTVKEAAELCYKNGFRIVSHTRDHWKTDCVRLSTLIDEFTQDIESADNCLADGMILVYPGGAKTRSVFAALKWLGYRIAISIATASDSYVSNTRSRNKYNLHRVEIGFRTTLEVIFNKIV